jgi:hypothetical protein
MLVRILLDSPDHFSVLEDMRLDLASKNFRKGADVIVTEDELDEIVSRGFTYEILIADPSMVDIDPEYRNYEETNEYILSLNLNYPDLTKRELIGVSQEFNVPIWGLKISDNPETEEDEPEILFNGVHHAREPLGNEICLGLARTLLEGYGVDPDLTTFVDEEEIWIIPIINTEGFKYLMDNNLSSPWWRKNQRDNNNNGMFDENYDGVDLNRNYDWYWSNGGSGYPSDWTYRGPSPFSESEMQSVRDLASLAHRFIFSISYHSYGEEVIWSWNWPNNPPPDEDVIVEVVEELASRITQRDGTGTYWTVAGDGQSGIARNWFYGVMGTIDFTVETCDEFIPSGTAIDSVVDANIPGALYLLDRALIGPGITGHVTDQQSGDPLEASVVVQDRDTDLIVPRTCEPSYGRYFRLLPPGEYTITYSMEGYVDREELVVVGSEDYTVVDVELKRIFPHHAFPVEW